MTKGYADPKLPHGTNYCKCSGCGEYFSTDRNFQMHRRWDGQNRICVPPSKLVDKHGKARLRKNAKGYWSEPGGVYIKPKG